MNNNLDLKLTIRKNNSETICTISTRTISWKVFKKIIKIFDVKNLISKLPVILETFGKINKVKKENLASDVESILPILQEVTDIVIDNMDEVIDILVDVFSIHELSNEDIEGCDFDEIITCCISLITNAAQRLNLIKDHDSKKK